MWRSIWKDEPIFPSIYSANPPAGVQLLCPIKLAVVALFYRAGQQSSKVKYPEAVEEQEQQHCPEQVPCAGSWSIIPLLLPSLCQFVFHLHCLFQAWCLFSCLWSRQGGEREIFMNLILYLLSFFCVCVPSFWSLPSSCIQLLHPEQGSKLAPQQWPICLRVHGEKEGQTLVDKRLFRIL